MIINLFLESEVIKASKIVSNAKFHTWLFDSQSYHVGKFTFIKKNTIKTAQVNAENLKVIEQFNHHFLAQNFFSGMIHC